jgi:hypothetical protein
MAHLEREGTLQAVAVAMVMALLDLQEVSEVVRQAQAEILVATV